MTGLPYFDLTGRVAIVTGGATGIGRGIAEGLAEAGADIVIGSRRLEKCAEACREIGRRTGVQTLPLAVDVKNADGAEKFVDDIVKAMGHIDILVNNAGVIDEKPILEMEEADWDLMLDTNLKGVFTLSRAVVRRMVERNKGGKIINVASIAGIIAWPKMAAYCASKGGCIQLTKVMALEWARYDIQANAILPGYFLTPMSADFVGSDEGQQAVKSHIPMRRAARIDEIKGVAVLLASQGSSFITGASFAVDGGQACR
ncbi:MAG: glucose 1-dehydrogenase [Gammaproteobacteria bacterium]|nr:glucose 1-dehydrogenase [Gammaproteobacteria bacterium]